MLSTHHSFFDLGLIAYQQGDFEKACLHFKTLLCAYPAKTALWANFAIVSQQTSLSPLSYQAFKWAKYIDPYNADLYCLEADLYKDQNIAFSLSLLRKALILNPILTNGLNNLGQLLLQADDKIHAIVYWLWALYSAPHAYQPRLNLAGLFCDIEKSEQAYPFLQTALCLEPNQPKIWHNMALCHIKKRDFIRSKSYYFRAILLDVTSLDTVLSLSSLLIECYDLLRGQDFCTLALIQDPCLSLAWNNLGNRYYLENYFKKSEKNLKRAALIEPESATIAFNLAAPLLKNRKFIEGWQAYLKRPFISTLSRSIKAPLWQGEDLTDKIILLWAEQGYGDVLQFCRYGPLLAQTYPEASLVMRVYPSLVTLLKSLETETLIIISTESITPLVDYHLPLMSCPSYLGQDFGALSFPYLKLKGQTLLKWKNQIPLTKTLKVGLAWAGEPRLQDDNAYFLDQRRSLSLQTLSPLSACPNIDWISLQTGQAHREIDQKNHSFQFVGTNEKSQSFEETAALIESLDLVISVDTAIAHLSAALGKETWLLSRFDGCWRWLDAGSKSDWYPTMTIFRQKKPFDWQSVIDDVLLHLTTTSMLALESKEGQI